MVIFAAERVGYPLAQFVPHVAGRPTRPPSDRTQKSPEFALNYR